jgi:3-isopropylmalate/(R)-2-methylmalate dehydratase small subunit
MDKFIKLSSLVVPLPVNDVDTDMILPAQFLTSTSREGYGEKLFRRLRDNDAAFPLNQDKYHGAQILVAGNNFGCGSSREHAVWAIVGGGFRVVIAKAFADIFYNNSAKNGLLLVTLSSKVIDKVLGLAKAGQYVIEVDLERQAVTLPDASEHSFEYDPFRKHCLLNGLDDIDYIMSHKAAIDEFRIQHESCRFCFTL